jgi:hypothetical protein
VKSAKQLQHFFDAVDRAQEQQTSVVLSITLALEGQEHVEPMTLEFEILPPTYELTDTKKKPNKQPKH